MPLANYNEELTWYEAYKGPPREYVGPNPPILGYVRSRKDVLLGDDHWLLRDALGILSGQTILLVGAGFGWIAEDWAAAGLGPICAVDTSTWIQANKTQHSAIQVYNEDLSKNTGRNNVKQILGITGNNKIRWTITEDILPTLSDAECIQLSSFLRNISTTVAHWVTVPTDLAPTIGHQWRTAAQCKALLTPDIIAPRSEGWVL